MEPTYIIAIIVAVVILLWYMGYVTVTSTPVKKEGIDVRGRAHKLVGQYSTGANVLGRTNA